MPVYSEIFNGPARSYRRTSGSPITSRKRYITIHNTSNDASAEGEASYAKVRTDGTSSHYYVDNNSIVQSLNTDWCAGHVGSLEGNTYGISYEITGVNGWSRTTWLSNVAWELLARQVAIDCKQFGILPRLLTIAEMRGGTAKGFITHDMARQAWGGTDHTDPGPGFPMDHLLGRVSALIGDDMPTGPEITSHVWDWGPAPDGYNMRDHMLNAERSAAKALALVEKLLEESGIDPEELEAIKAAASAGAEAGVAKGADELAAALAPLLELDEAKVKAALAEVLGQARITVIPAS